MFDFSFGELLLVALVALVVLGPERLPKAARFTGLWVRRARAHWFSMKAELENELAADELKRSLQAGREALREAETGVRENLHETEAQLQRGVDEVRAVVERPHDAPSPTVDEGRRDD